MLTYESLNKYLSNLSVLITKTHNIHWNVVGAQFVPIHQYTEELYDFYFDKYDSVAEIIKMKGEFPLVKITDYLKLATVEEIDAKDFSSVEALELVKKDIELMLNDALQIREEYDARGEFLIVNEFEDHITHYVKQLWFIKSILKNN
ncbi:MAG: DNA starvation/stationary phase protection protein [Fusobacterium sp.]|nr:DNA starvation/stationary phase protection protein [Fusobacterium sp.]